MLKYTLVFSVLSLLVCEIAWVHPVEVGEGVAVGAAELQPTPHLQVEAYKPQIL